jgi:hypothetical protein
MATVNWEAIGAIAELAGAVGVIASLVFVGFQVRGSNRASAVESKLQSTRLLHVFIDMLIETPELNDLYLRGLKDLESLSEAEYYRFSNMSLKAFWFFSAGHFQFRTGALGEEEWYEIRAVLHYWLRNPGCQAWWTKLGRKSFGAEFRGFIDAEIERLNGRASTASR